MTGWPRTQDYQSLASDYASIGLTQIGDLLSGVAAARQLLAQADARWQQRYAERPGTFRQQHARQFLRAGLISTDPAGPYPGTDGATYHPGVQEELVLVSMLTDPASIPAVSCCLPPSAFTSDTRYDLYAAILAVTGRGQRCDRDLAAAELTRRAAWIPRHALHAYGGPELPWAHAYLHRLDATPVTREAARQAVTALREEDHAAAAHAKSPAPPAPPGPHRVLSASPERRAQAAPAPENGPPQTQRPTAPDQPAAPAPRR
jgi:hypothetical protein